MNSGRNSSCLSQIVWDMERVIVNLVVLIVNFFQNAMSCGVEADNSAKLRIMDNGVLQPIELIICGRQGEYLVSKIRCIQRESNEKFERSRNASKDIL